MLLLDGYRPFSVLSNAKLHLVQGKHSIDLLQSQMLSKSRVVPELGVGGSVVVTATVRRECLRVHALNVCKPWSGKLLRP